MSKVLNTQEVGRTTNNMEPVSRRGQMAQNMKAIMSMVLKTEWENCYIRMDRIIVDR